MGIHEECGVFGVMNKKKEPVAELVYYGLYALQHRGQESCGIVVNDDGVFSSYALDVSEKIPVYSVVNSLLDALDADKVQITVGGKDRLDTFGKKMELYHFYERNDKLVVKEKE